MLPHKHAISDPIFSFKRLTTFFWYLGSLGQKLAANIFTLFEIYQYFINIFLYQLEFFLKIFSTSWNLSLEVELFLHYFKFLLKSICNLGLFKNIFEINWNLLLQVKFISILLKICSTSWNLGLFWNLFEIRDFMQHFFISLAIYCILQLNAFKRFARLLVRGDPYYTTCVFFLVLADIIEKKLTKNRLEIDQNSQEIIFKIALSELYWLK